MKYSKGIMWLDDCRIPFCSNENTNNWTSTRDKKPDKTGWGFRGDSGGAEMNNKGRFMANLLVCDDMLNDGNIIQYNKTRKDNGSYLGGHREDFVGTDNNPIVNKVKGQFFSDKGTNSRYYDLDRWFNKLIDEI